MHTAQPTCVEHYVYFLLVSFTILNNIVILRKLLIPFFLNLILKSVKVIFLTLFLKVLKLFS